MAESAAHFTATLEFKPSIFEIIAQDSLNSTLHPAFLKIADFLASLNPKKFSWLSQYYDEVFLILNSLLQYHYLRTKGASFSEYFYGLQRISTNSNTNSLSETSKQLSLVFLVVFPYIKRKLVEKIQLYKIENAERPFQTSIFKKALLMLHSILEIVYGFCTVIQYLRYMSNEIPYQSLLLQMLKIKLVYTMELQNDIGFWTALFRGQLRLSEIGSGLTENTVQAILELAAFMVQFLQAWNTERPNYSFGALPTVEPPPLDNRATDYKGKCPLCLQNWKIPTVLPVSGYVFCFPCIVRHLRENLYCPVTKLPAKPLDIIRLYDSDR